jgi:hypothetical protein
MDLCDYWYWKRADWSRHEKWKCQHLLSDQSENDVVVLVCLSMVELVLVASGARRILEALMIYWNLDEKRN